MMPKPCFKPDTKYIWHLKEETSYTLLWAGMELMDRVEYATHPAKGTQIQLEFRGCVSGARS